MIGYDHIHSQLGSGVHFFHRAYPAINRNQQPVSLFSQPPDCFTVHPVPFRKAVGHIIIDHAPQLLQAFQQDDDTAYPVDIIVAIYHYLFLP